MLIYSMGVSVDGFIAASRALGAIDTDVAIGDA